MAVTWTPLPEIPLYIPSKYGRGKYGRGKYGKGVSNEKWIAETSPVSPWAGSAEPPNPWVPLDG